MVAAAWQEWAPTAPDELTANLTLVAEPGRADHEVVAFGASMLEEPHDPAAAGPARPRSRAAPT